ncbi:hypothetical protein WDU94_010813 [Cyamophila willieti]
MIPGFPHSSFSISFILVKKALDCIDGKGLRQRAGTNDGKLVDRDKRTVAKVVINYLLTNEPNRQLGGPEFSVLANQIKEEFPAEISTIYYAVGVTEEEEEEEEEEKEEELTVKRVKFEVELSREEVEDACVTLVTSDARPNGVNSGLLGGHAIKSAPKTKETLRVSHLSYIDDIKLFAESKENLSKLINITKNFSDDIKMKFGMDKCAIINIHRGKVIENDTSINEINPLRNDEQYKYLGILENQDIDHNNMKKNYTEEYRKRLTKLLNTYLNGRNMIDAINTWAVPSLTYSFGIIKWNETELEELDFMTRRLLCKFRMLHPKACIERLYLPRKEGGRGLTNIKLLCMKQELKMKERFQKNNDEIMKTIVQVDKKYTALNLSENTRPDVHPSTKEDLINTWKAKILHGRYLNFINDVNINKTVSLKWIIQGYLHPETEGFCTAIQDKVVRTKNYEKFILKKDVVDKCRKCQQPGETIEHIVDD